MAENSSMGGPMEKQPQEPEEHLPPQEGSYWGSVRFFKHLILTVLALAILIPTALSIRFGMSLGQTKAELKQLRHPALPRPACGGRFPDCGRQLPGPGEGTAA